MRITIYAVGRLKAGPERELVDRYCDRLAKAGRAIGLEFSGIVEIAESQASASANRKSDETSALLARIPEAAIVIALDEAGKSASSGKFASTIARYRDEGMRNLAIVIGGPDGHGPQLAPRADLTLCFGAMTWPHQIVRILAAEQLYRAVTILTGHPYHRQ